MTQLTQEQASRLAVLRLVKNDAAAAGVAIKFIGDDPLKLELFSDRYKEETVNEGNGYHDRSGVANTVSQSPDYVTVFFGTNDWGQVRNSKPLGAFLDTGTATISGCINTCLLGVITKFYSTRIAVFTPLPREKSWGSNAQPNVVGYTLEQLASLIKRYADHYSIPCLDLYHSSNLPVYTAAGNAFYFTAPSLSL